MDSRFDFIARTISWTIGWLSEETPFSIRNVFTSSARSTIESLGARLSSPTTKANVEKLVQEWLSYNMSSKATQKTHASAGAKPVLEHDVCTPKRYRYTRSISLISWRDTCIPNQA